jgi:hypothetical protein
VSASESLYAEIRLAVRGDLPADLATSLRDRLEARTQPGGALRHTTFRRTADVESSVVAARLTPDTVHLVFKDDARRLRVHLQRREVDSGLVEIRRSAEALADQFADYVRYHELKLVDLHVSIYARRSLLQTGRKRNFTQRVRDMLRTEVATTLSIPVVAVLVSAVIGGDVGESLRNGLIAFLALLFRAVAGALLEKMEYRYE